MSAMPNLKRKEVVQTPTCTVCGAETEWDFDLGAEPLCVDCWDEMESGVASYVPFDTTSGPLTDRQRRQRDKKRAYREAHRDEISDKQRAYYEAHRDEISDKKRQMGLTGGRRRFTLEEDRQILGLRDENGLSFFEIGLILVRNSTVVRNRYQGLKAFSVRPAPVAEYDGDSHCHLCRREIYVVAGTPEVCWRCGLAVDS